MVNTAKYTLLFAAIWVFFGACGNNTETKDLNDVSESQSVDPAIITDNRSAVNPGATNPEPQFEFNTTEWNFGTITEGMRPTFVFKYKNVGNSDLIISGCEASCGCTTPEWTKEPVPPGGTGEIHVAFNSSGKHGSQHKTVTVTANTNPPRTELKVTGEIERK